MRGRVISTTFQSLGLAWWGMFWNGDRKNIIIGKFYNIFLHLSNCGVSIFCVSTTIWEGIFTTWSITSSLLWIWDFTIEFSVVFYVFFVNHFRYFAILIKFVEILSWRHTFKRSAVITNDIFLRRREMTHISLKSSYVTNVNYNYLKLQNG